jgi:hypothetical protein
MRVAFGAGLLLWLLSCSGSDISLGNDTKRVAVPCTSPPCITVYNNCPMALWTHAISTVTIDEGNVRRLDPGQSYQYASLPMLGGGRVYAYYEQPAVLQNSLRLVSPKNQFVEMAIDTDTTNAWAQNYNISYVDSIALPVSVKASGGCAATACSHPFEEWKTLLAGCPTDLRNQAAGVGTCMGSYNYCITGDDGSTYDTTREYCSKMEAAHGYAGSRVYGGVFPEQPAQNVTFWDQVAAWNRGCAAGDADESNYYKAEPYNDYAAFVHLTLGCRGVFAFSTDDHQNKGGFVRCTSPDLSVVWCPDR